MTNRFTFRKITVLALITLAVCLFGCKTAPEPSTRSQSSSSSSSTPSVINTNPTQPTPYGSHKFFCHAASPGQCAYAVFNESGSIRETFFLAPGEARIVANIQARTAFCLSAGKPLDPIKCQRLGLDGKSFTK